MSILVSDDGYKAPDGSRNPYYPGHELIQEMKDLKAQIPKRRGRKKATRSQKADTKKREEGKKKQKERAKAKTEKAKDARAEVVKNDHRKAAMWSKYIEKLLHEKKGALADAVSENPLLAPHEVKRWVEVYGFSVLKCGAIVESYNKKQFKGL